MDARTAERLTTSMELTGDIIRLARRYFSNVEDREDARQHAWLSIFERAQSGCTVDQAKKVARCAIYAKYMRALRERKHRMM